MQKHISLEQNTRIEQTFTTKYSHQQHQHHCQVLKNKLKDEDTIVVDNKQRNNNRLELLGVGEDEGEDREEKIKRRARLKALLTPTRTRETTNFIQHTQLAVSLRISLSSSTATLATLNSSLFSSKKPIEEAMTIEPSSKLFNNIEIFKVESRQHEDHDVKHSLEDSLTSGMSVESLNILTSNSSCSSSSRNSKESSIKLDSSSSIENDKMSNGDLLSNEEKRETLKCNKINDDFFKNVMRKTCQETDNNDEDDDEDEDNDDIYVDSDD